MVRINRIAMRCLAVCIMLGYNTLCSPLADAMLATTVDEIDFGYVAPDGSTYSL